ncbi:hypothetical protein F4808DRAFT_367408 [Astrocystis sublimbata]|nr:hypothetical protein F4808DRAFT_367408 [Astrocystis sublimbata]
MSMAQSSHDDPAPQPPAKSLGLKLQSRSLLERSDRSTRPLSEKLEIGRCHKPCMTPGQNTSRVTDGKQRRPSAPPPVPSEHRKEKPSSPSLIHKERQMLILWPIVNIDVKSHLAEQIPSIHDWIVATPCIWAKKSYAVWSHAQPLTVLINSTYCEVGEEKPYEDIVASIKKHFKGPIDIGWSGRPVFRRYEWRIAAASCSPQMHNHRLYAQNNPRPP